MEAAVAGLLSLSGKDDTVSPRTTPNASPRTTPNTSPTRPVFRVTGVKRVRDDVVDITYIDDLNAQKFTVPFFRNETMSTFYFRRDSMAQGAQKEEDERVTAYVSWQDKLVSVVIKDYHWRKFKASNMQTRFLCGSIQLVIMRANCLARHAEQRCFNCKHPKWRASCLTTEVQCFVLPLPQFKKNLKQLDAELDRFTPLPVSASLDAAPWKARVPHLIIR